MLLRNNSVAPLIDRNLATPPQVYDLLRDRIQSSDLPPGTAINERALAEWLGISRTPIREAIRRLASEGLINVIPKVGTRVAPVDPARVIECCIIRNSLEFRAMQQSFKRDRIEHEVKVKGIRVLFESPDRSPLFFDR